MNSERAKKHIDIVLTFNPQNDHRDLNNFMFCLNQYGFFETKLHCNRAMSIPDNDGEKIMREWRRGSSQLSFDAHKHGCVLRMTPTYNGSSQLKITIGSEHLLERDVIDCYITNICDVAGINRHDVSIRLDAQSIKTYSSKDRQTQLTGVSR